MIGLRVSAMMNTQVKGRRSPRLRLSNRFPYVGMEVLLTAVKRVHVFDLKRRGE